MNDGIIKIKIKINIKDKDKVTKVDLFGACVRRLISSGPRLLELIVLFVQPSAREKLKLPFLRMNGIYYRQKK